MRIFETAKRRAARLLAAVPAAVIAACAAAPNDIPPSYVSPVHYQNWTCGQLAAEGHRLIAAFTQAASRQEQARTNDAVGVLLVGLPVGSMSGQNIAPEIGRLKGEHEAIHRAAIEKNCTVTETASVR